MKLLFKLSKRADGISIYLNKKFNILNHINVSLF